jgi:hypothetical protein
MFYELVIFKLINQGFLYRSIIFLAEGWLLNQTLQIDFDLIKSRVYLIFQKGSSLPVFVFQLLDQSKSFIPYGSDAEDAERNGWEEYGQQENNDQLFLPFDGKL